MNARVAATAREPSTTNNCWPSRAQKSRGKAGTRRPSGRSAKNPLPHRHRQKVRNPIISTTCSCGISAVSATTCDCGACTTNTTGTSTTFQMYCNCEISMVRAIDLHSFLHFLDHRHLSLTTAGMSTTLSKNSRDETIFSTSGNCGRTTVSSTTQPEEPARPAQKGHRSPYRRKTRESLWFSEQPGP